MTLYVKKERLESVDSNVGYNLDELQPIDNGHVTSAVDDFVESVNNAENLKNTATESNGSEENTVLQDQNEPCGDEKETMISINDVPDIPNDSEVLDSKSDKVLDELLEEAKLRDSDLLSDENEINIEDDIGFVDEFTNFVFNDIENSAPKADDSKSKQNRFTDPLFEGSPYTLGVVILLICCFVIRFRLPDEAISYLLRLLACILPLGHTLSGSLYHFRKTIRLFTDCLIPSLTYHCNSCYEIVGKNEKNCPSCNNSLTESRSRAYFMQLKLVSQLQALWKNKEFCDMVRKHRFEHFENNKEDKLSDIYDGLLYKRLFQNDGILSSPNNLSFSLNTDGAPLFKSSNISIWPVYMLINELPITQRKKRNYALFYGVWISCRKPQMWSFLKPLYEELNVLGSKGHTFCDYYGSTFDCKCFLLTCTCDLPARAIVYNCNQFNGDFSCWFCLQKGETFKHESGGISHVYPFKESPKDPPRTPKTVKRDVQLASTKIRNHESKTTVNGHKGKFWFMYLDNFDPIYSCVIDYMHGICLGVCKQLLTLWFDKKNKSESFSFFVKCNDVNSFLSRIKPTLYVTRIPKALNELSHWKSSEFRNFILYWGIPILKNVLTQEYFVHFCLLARSFFILSKEGTSKEELLVVESALLLFVENYQVLYGERFMTLNVHQLVHLTDCVRHTGPLYVNNCFIFEDLNGFIVKHIHGTQGVDTQITNIVCMLKVPPVLRELFLKDYDDGEEIVSLYNELTDSVTGRYKYLSEIEEGIRPIGNVFIKELTDSDRHCALKFGVHNVLVKCFYRINMYKKGFYVYGQAYDRLKKRQQNVVTYITRDSIKFGNVVFFIQSEEQNRIVNLAKVRLLPKIQSVGCVWQVGISDDVDFIPIQSIINVNNFVVINDQNYVCPSPNRYDRD